MTPALRGMTPQAVWQTWLSASRVWAAYTKHGNTIHSCESICLSYLGQPVRACEYTVPLADRRGKGETP